MVAHDLSISVIICAFTGDRWHDLVAAVNSLATQVRSADEVVVVIDHNEALFERAQAAFTAATVARNDERQGLSGARNTGVRTASGDIVLFLDDDAVADPAWVERMCTPFADASVVGVGGFADPAWDAPGPPRWFPPEMLWVVGCSYRGLPVDGAVLRNPLGCAMAFRRGAVLAAGGFSSALGRVGKIPLGGEETELSLRIANDEPHGRIVHARQAVIQHRVRAERQTMRYLARRCYSEGISKAQIAKTSRRGALDNERSFALRTLGTFGATVLTAGPRMVRERSVYPLQAATAMLVALTAAGVGYLTGHVRTATVPK